eukprot:g2970.t1
MKKSVDGTKAPEREFFQKPEREFVQTLCIMLFILSGCYFNLLSFPITLLIVIVWQYYRFVNLQQESLCSYLHRTLEMDKKKKIAQILRSKPSWIVDGVGKPYNTVPDWCTDKSFGGGSEMGETAEWLNLFFKGHWPQWSEAIEKNLRDGLDSSFELYKPSSLSHLITTTCELKNLQPKIISIHTWTNNEITAHNRLEPDEDKWLDASRTTIDIGLEIGSGDIDTGSALVVTAFLASTNSAIPFGLGNLHIRGMLRVEMYNFENQIPPFEEISICFVDLPLIEYSLKALSDVFNPAAWPGVKGKIRHGVREGLRSAMVWPVRLPISLVYDLVPKAEGILEIAILEAEDLINLADPEDYPDVYCKVEFGREDKYAGTKMVEEETVVVWHTLSPVWNTELIIHVKSSQHDEAPRLTVRNQNQWFPTVVMGECMLRKIKDMEPKRAYDEWLDLTLPRKKEKQGRIHVKYRWNDHPKIDDDIGAIPETQGVLNTKSPSTPSGNNASLRNISLSITGTAMNIGNSPELNRVKGAKSLQNILQKSSNNMGEEKSASPVSIQTKESENDEITQIVGGGSLIRDNVLSQNEVDMVDEIAQKWQDTFSGEDLVQWLVRSDYCSSKQQALRIGNKMLYMNALLATSPSSVPFKESASSCYIVHVSMRVRLELTRQKVPLLPELKRLLEEVDTETLLLDHVEGGKDHLATAAHMIGEGLAEPENVLSPMQDLLMRSFMGDNGKEKRESAHAQIKLALEEVVAILYSNESHVVSLSCKLLSKLCMSSAIRILFFETKIPESVLHMIKNKKTVSPQEGQLLSPKRRTQVASVSTNPECDVRSPVAQLVWLSSGGGYSSKWQSVRQNARRVLRRLVELSQDKVNLIMYKLNLSDLFALTEADATDVVRCAVHALAERALLADSPKVPQLLTWTRAGHMWRKTGLHRKWRRRWVIIKQGFYYEFDEFTRSDKFSRHASSNKVLHRVVNLAGCRTELDTLPGKEEERKRRLGKRLSFELVIPDNVHHSLYLCTDTDLETHMWNEVLQNVISIINGSRGCRGASDEFERSRKSIVKTSPLSKLSLVSNGEQGAKRNDSIHSKDSVDLNEESDENYSDSGNESENERRRSSSQSFRDFQSPNRGNSAKKKKKKKKMKKAKGQKGDGFFSKIKRAVGIEASRCKMLNVFRKEQLFREDIDDDFPTSLTRDKFEGVALRTNRKLRDLYAEGKLRGRLLQLINLTYSNDPSTCIHVARILSVLSKSYGGLPYSKHRSRLLPFICESINRAVLFYLSENKLNFGGVKYLARKHRVSMRWMSVSRLEAFEILAASIMAQGVANGLAPSAVPLDWPLLACEDTLLKRMRLYLQSPYKRVNKTNFGDGSDPLTEAYNDCQKEWEERGWSGKEEEENGTEPFDILKTEFLSPKRLKRGSKAFEDSEKNRILAAVEVLFVADRKVSLNVVRKHIQQEFNEGALNRHANAIKLHLKELVNGEFGPVENGSKEEKGGFESPVVRKRRESFLRSRGKLSGINATNRLKRKESLMHASNAAGEMFATMQMKPKPVE